MMQVTVGCGKVCLFYVGGCAEFTTQDGGVPRWEFFIGDRPHHPGPDKHGRRPPIAQVGTPCVSLHQSSAPLPRGDLSVTGQTAAREGHLAAPQAVLTWLIATELSLSWRVLCASIPALHWYLPLPASLCSWQCPKSIFVFSEWHQLSTRLR